LPEPGVLRLDFGIHSKSTSLPLVPVSTQSDFAESCENMAARYLIRADSVADGAAVPEMVQLRLAREAALAEEKQKAVAVAIKEEEEKREALRLRTEGYYKEYAEAEQQLINLRREAKLQGNFFLEPEPKLIFLIRISGINNKAPKPRKVMQLFRIRQIHNGVFVKVNKPMLNMLKLIQPFVTYGYPNLKTVRQLIYKRGFGKVNKQRIPLSDNSIVSENLGKYGIHGIEDIIHEIYTVGPNFKQVNNFLWPFKLQGPRGGFKCKRHGYCEQKGGDWGNREEMINELVRRMN